MSSNINRVSPVLKRFIPGQLFTKNGRNPKTKKKENEEKEEEDSKVRGDDLQINPYQNQISRQNNGINIKTVVNIHRNDLSLSGGSKNIGECNPGNNQINPGISNFSMPTGANSRIMEKELDKLFEKILIHKEKNPNTIPRKLNFLPENVFRKNMQIFKLENIDLKHKNEREKMENTSSVNSGVSVNMFSQIEKNENIFLGKKRSPEDPIEEENKPNNKAHRPNEIESVSNHSTTHSYTSPTPQPNQNKFSLFDRFFMVFKKDIFPHYKIEATISNDKSIFTFTYQRTSGDKIFYKVTYDQQLKIVKQLQKYQNDHPILHREEEENQNNLRWYADELKALVEDVTANVEKK